MKFGLEENIIEKIKRVLEEQPKVDKAYIFGSRAKGNYRPDSDIDIAVKGYDLTVEDMLKMSARMDKSGIGYEVDLVHYGSIKEKELREHVDRLGMEFYNKWKTYTLGSLCSDIAYGYTASASDIPTGPKFLRITDIVPYQVNWESVPYCEISDKDYNKYKLNRGDIVIARTGATTGYNYLFNEDVDAVFASYLIKYEIDKSKANPFFIGHVLKSEYWKGFVEGIISGSAQPGANAQMFASFEIKLPPLEEQAGIAESLSILDEKINILHRQNKTLESIAKLLFKHWFIKAADKSWNYTKLKDMDIIITDYVANGSFESLANNVNYKSNPDYAILIRLTDYNNSFNGDFVYVDEHAYNFLKKSKLFGGEVIISNVGEYSGTVFKCPHLHRPMTLGPNSIVVKSKFNNYFYLFFSSDYGKHLLDSIISGSAQPKFNKTVFRDLEIFYPSIEYIIDFEKAVTPYFNKIDSNKNQAFLLTQLRDTLLSKLISGEARVKMP